MFKILIAEDEKNLRTLCQKNLELGGYSVTAAEDGLQALEFLESSPYDLVITDVLMPRLDGNGLLHAVKKFDSNIPVLMLTALETINDKRTSFDIGADDYLTKPVDYEELLLRVKAALRKYQRVSSQTLTHKETTLCFSQKSVKVGENQVELTKKEFLLLYMLVSSPNRIFSRAQIFDEIWGFDSSSLDRTVDVHINKLREKLENSSIKIVTLRGLGYKAVLQ